MASHFVLEYDQDGGKRIATCSRQPVVFHRGNSPFYPRRKCCAMIAVVNTSLPRFFFTFLVCFSIDNGSITLPADRVTTGSGVLFHFAYWTLASLRDIISPIPLITVNFLWKGQGRAMCSRQNQQACSCAWSCRPTGLRHHTRSWEVPPRVPTPTVLFNRLEFSFHCPNP